MYRFCTLFSGSSGNSTYIGTDKEGILVDIGKNAKQTTMSLAELGLSPECVKAVFITHEHSDHIAGLRVFCNKHKIPVYATLGTLQALEDAGHLKGDFPVFQITDYADIGDLHIQCFNTFHDSADSCGYTIEFSNGVKTAVATDLGVVTDEALEALLGSKTLLLESNHDINMLQTGPYPYYLKRRILSENGHLCNDDAAKTVLKLVENGAEHIMLGHLSSENNHPDLAFQTTKSVMDSAGVLLDRDYTLTVASRHEPKTVMI